MKWILISSFCRIFIRSSEIVLKKKWKRTKSCLSDSPVSGIFRLVALSVTCAWFTQQGLRKELVRERVPRVLRRALLVYKRMKISAVWVSLSLSTKFPIEWVLVVSILRRERSFQERTSESMEWALLLFDVLISPTDDCSWTSATTIVTKMSALYHQQPSFYHTPTQTCIVYHYIQSDE